jgi:hypothetical protein
MLLQVIHRIKYDRAFQLAFSEEFERSFTPIDYFFASVQKFFITSISEIQKRFSFKDHEFQIPPLVKPKNARNLCPASLSSLFKRFPLLNDHCNVVEADKEWRSHVNMPIDYFEIDSSQSTFAFYILQHGCRILLESCICWICCKTSQWGATIPQLESLYFPPTFFAV